MQAEMTIVAFQDIFQNEARRKGVFTDEFRQLSAQIILDKQDMTRLGVKDGQRVLVKNEVNGVVVSARTSEDDAHPGLAFMILQPLVQSAGQGRRCDVSIPGFKRIAASVSPTEENATQISEILQRMRA